MFVQTVKPGFHSNATQAIAFEWKPGFTQALSQSRKLCETIKLSNVH